MTFVRHRCGAFIDVCEEKQSQGMTLNLIAKGSGYYFVGKLQAILFLLLQKKPAIFGILSKLDFRFSNPN